LKYLPLLNTELVKESRSVPLMNEYRKVNVRFHTFLTSALDGGERLTSSPRHFDYGEKNLYLRNRRVGGAADGFNAH